MTELQKTNHHLGDKGVGLTATHLQNGKHPLSQPLSNNYIGLTMGRQPSYTEDKAKQHWATAQTGSLCEKTAPPTIAAVNWTAQVITMFIKPVDWEKETYYRNYQVLNPDLAHFEKEYKEFVVFSGVIEDGKLTGTNSPIVVADGDRCTNYMPHDHLFSTNKHTLVGIAIGIESKYAEGIIWIELEQRIV